MTALLPRTDAPYDGDERATLEGTLAWNRSTVALKAGGLDDALARRRILPSLTTVTGLVQHLTDVEKSWFLEDMLGQAIDPRWSEADPDGEFRVDESSSLVVALAEYEAACTATTAAVAELPLDARTTNGKFTLRWVLLHMIEETARHAGHIDVLRELLDGVTGE